MKMEKIQNCITSFTVMREHWNMKLPSLTDPEKIFSTIKNYILDEKVSKNSRDITEYVTALAILVKNSKYEKRIDSVLSINSEIISPCDIPSFDEDEAWILLLAFETYLN